MVITFADIESAGMQRKLFVSAMKCVSKSDIYMSPNLIGSSVDVVGTADRQQGRNCAKHPCSCGQALVVGSYICFRKEQFAWQGAGIEDVLVVYSMFEGMECKVGYLPKHLAVRADTYAGLCACIVEIYSSTSEVTAKRQKYHRNKGCCVAEIIDMEICLIFALWVKG